MGFKLDDERLAVNRTSPIVDRLPKRMSALSRRSTHSQ